MTAPRQIGRRPLLRQEPQQAINASQIRQFRWIPKKCLQPAAAHAVIQIKERDSYAVTAIADVTDRSLPRSNWPIHVRDFAGCPGSCLFGLGNATYLRAGKRLQLLDKAMRKLFDSPITPVAA